MKLITWNCQGAFRKKSDTILSLKPDILIVQECECSDKLIFSSTTKQPNDFYWYGDNPHKGIGIYSYSDYRFELLPVFNTEFRYVLPFRVTCHGQSFNLFAIWAMDNKENRQARYIGQVWFALNYYSSLLDGPTILAGDFNSNKIWDYKDRVGSHTDVVTKLADKNIHSIYHRHFKSEQGKEKHPTFFLHRNKNKPYHLDYCFASADFADKVVDVKVGTYQKWIEYSDHSPLKVTFDF
jgi:exodeoxyribonuclease-3